MGRIYGWNKCPGSRKMEHMCPFCSSTCACQSHFSPTPTMQTYTRDTERERERAHTVVVKPQEFSRPCRERNRAQTADKPLPRTIVEMYRQQTRGFSRKAEKVREWYAPNTQQRPPFFFSRIDYIPAGARRPRRRPSRSASAPHRCSRGASAPPPSFRSRPRSSCPGACTRAGRPPRAWIPSGRGGPRPPLRRRSRSPTPSPHPGTGRFAPICLGPRIRTAPSPGAAVACAGSRVW